MAPAVKATPEEVVGQVKGRDIRIPARARPVNRNPHINRDLSKFGSPGDEVPTRRTRALSWF